MNLDSRLPAPDARFLRIYLQDHHAAAAGGVDLARRLARQARNGKYGRELSDLARQIASNRDELTSILQRVGVKHSPTKIVLARLGERLSRLKPNGAIASYSALDQLIALETLATGIVGQRALWRSLATAKASVPALAHTDLERLFTSAEAQFNRVERIRIETAAAAFTQSPPDGPPRDPELPGEPEPAPPGPGEPYPVP